MKAPKQIVVPFTSTDGRFDGSATRAWGGPPLNLHEEVGGCLRGGVVGVSGLSDTLVVAHVRHEVQGKSKFTTLYITQPYILGGRSDTPESVFLAKDGWELSYQSHQSARP